MKPIKCLLGCHKYIWLWNADGTQQSVWACKRCRRYYIYHYGIGCGFSTKHLPTYLIKEETHEND